MKSSKGFSSIVILGVICILIIGMIGGIIWMSFQKSTPQAAKIQLASPTQIPSFIEKTLDLSNGVADSQKTVIIIQQSDSSREKVILPTSSVQAYLTGLPMGTKVISQASFTK